MAPKAYCARLPHKEFVEAVYDIKNHHRLFIMGVCCPELGFITLVNGCNEFFTMRTK